MQLVSRSVDETIKIGNRIARYLYPRDILCLFGNLGSGKTVLTQGVAWGLGIKEDKIISPTFVLLRQYTQARIPFYHFDLYRLKTPKDILNLGYEEYFYDEAVSVIEWADRLKYLLPAEYLKIELLIKNTQQRILKFSPCGVRYRQLLKKLSESR